MSDKGQWVRKLNAIEEEVVVLKAVTDLIDSIMNYRFFNPINADAKQVTFRPDVQTELFNVILVDLLSYTDKNGPVKNKTYLSWLTSIVENPHFNVCDTVGELAERTREFQDWLKITFTIEDVGLPSIDRPIPLTMSRLDLIKIGGNICRHGTLRATGIARAVRKIYAENGTEITPEQALLILPDLNENWLHRNIFQYHSSTIAEFLNNIRWGIYHYLKPESEGSRKVMDSGVDELPKYHYVCPDGVKDDFAQSCYRDLMKKIRKEPIMRAFDVSEIFKKRY